MDTTEYKKAVLERLKRLEAERGVKVLYAAVVGSRAYGLASENSDCDTKFVFVHPLERYLDVDAPQEYMDAGDDVTGYDLRKFLQMVRKSGFNTFEMLYSPEVVVCASDEFLNAVRGACKAFMNPGAMCVSYLGCLRRSKKCFDAAADEAGMVKHAVAATRLYLSAYVCHFSKVNPPVVFDELVREACRETSVLALDARRFADAKRNGTGAEGVRAFMDKVVGLADQLADVVQDESDRGSARRRDMVEANEFLNKLFKETVGFNA